MTRRSGFTLIELLVVLVILGIVGLGLSSLYVSQVRSYDREAQLRRAQFVSRSAINTAVSDMRMVEATGGVVSATSKIITLRVPYAMGVVCANTATNTTVALFPVDSALYATAGFSGYAWRDSLGVYTYVESGVSVSSGVTSVCTTAGVTVLANGKTVAVSPAMPAALATNAAVGTAVFLYQKLTYEFKASTALSGRTGLWRTVVATSQADELVAPFDSTAKFRFFLSGRDTAQTGVPSPLTLIRGLELNFNAQSERAGEGQTAYSAANVATAVFFNNAIK